MSFDILKVKTVDEFLQWKSSSQKGIEEIYAQVTLNDLGWGNTDVMYSFLGIYAIGVWVYNKDKFRVTNYYIKENGKRQSIYSYDFIKKIQNDDSYDLKELNEKFRDFIEVYSSLGNVMPIWPGGNKEKGKTQGCFDIPELYFNKHYEWFLALRQIYRNNICFDGIINKRTPQKQCYRSLQDFLKTVETPEKYEELLDKVVSNIKTREKEVNNFIELRRSMEPKK